MENDPRNWRPPGRRNDERSINKKFMRRERTIWKKTAENHAHFGEKNIETSNDERTEERFRAFGDPTFPKRANREIMRQRMTETWTKFGCEDFLKLGKDPRHFANSKSGFATLLELRTYLDLHTRRYASAGIVNINISLFSVRLSVRVGNARIPIRVINVRSSARVVNVRRVRHAASFARRKLALPDNQACRSTSNSTTITYLASLANPRHAHTKRDSRQSRSIDIFDRITSYRCYILFKRLGVPRSLDRWWFLLPLFLARLDPLYILTIASRINLYAW